LNRLLLDIGASSIKSAIQRNLEVDPQTLLTTESFSTKHGDSFNSDIIVSEFLSHVKKQHIDNFFDEIWICSEMHNFTLLEISNNEYSNFYSWRFSNLESINNRKKIEQNHPHVIKKTGQSLYDGMPVLNFGDCLNKNSTYRILSLPELIVSKVGLPSNKIHDSMAASLGFFDIKQKTWLKEVLFSTYPKVEFHLPSIFEDNEIPFLGSISLNENEINIFGGFGDLQTALYGAEIQDDQICINIGTGSQVIAICDEEYIPRNPIDMKPFFGKYIKTITHIPAGRSFNYLNKTVFKDPNFWTNLSLINAEINNNITNQTFSLNIFETNWRYDSNNILFIRKLFKKDKNFYNLFLENFCLEYSLALSLLDNKLEYKKLLLSGGKLKNIPYITNFFNNLDTYTLVNSINTSKIDETIIGLDKLTKKYY